MRIAASLAGGILLAALLVFLPIFPNRRSAAADTETEGEAEEAPSRVRAESPAPPPVLLDGRPFPHHAPFEPAFPEPKRVRYVSASPVAPVAPGAGDGSEARP